MKNDESDKLDCCKTHSKHAKYTFIISVLISITLAVVGIVSKIILPAVICLAVYNAIYAQNDNGKQRDHLNKLDDLIKKVRVSSKEMKPCPLIFPIRGDDGKLTPLGSYISYVAMIKAANTPGGELSIPDVGSLFSDLRLFDPIHIPVQNEYYKQLPFRFKTRECCDGSLKKEENQYDITLLFTNGKSQRQFNKKFSFDRINEAPDWVAQCVWGSAGNKPDKAQMEYFSTPVFKDAQNFEKCARIEHFMRFWPALACGLDKMLKKEPDNPFIKNRLLWVYRQRGESNGPILEYQIMADKSPFYLYDNLSNCIQDVEDDTTCAVPVIERIMKDNNNVFLYQTAVNKLNEMGLFEQSVELIKAWCGLHPENQDSWIELSRSYRDWMSSIRGSGYANTVQSSSRMNIEKLAKESVKAAKRSIKAAPEDCWTWGRMLNTGVFAGFRKQDMWDYFNKAIKLNPYYYPAYKYMNRYLQPKWHGSEAEAEAFYSQYYIKYPYVIYEISIDGFMQGGPREYTGSDEIREDYIQSVASSPYYEDFVKIMPFHLGIQPFVPEDWKNYFHWMTLTGRRNEALDKAKKLIPKDNPDLVNLYPMLVLLALKDDVDSQATENARKVLEKKPDYIKLKGDALRELTEADEDNWWAWNEYAKFCIQNNMKKEAKKYLKAIDKKVNYAVWNAEKYEAALKSAGLK